MGDLAILLSTNRGASKEFCCILARNADCQEEVCEPCRAKLISSIASIHKMDVGLGKLVLDYGPTDHKGFDTVYPTVVKGGKPVVFTDWKTVRK